MKKILFIAAVSTFFLACKHKATNSVATDKNLVLSDTSLLHRSGLLSDTGTPAPVLAKNPNGVTTASSTTTTVVTTTTSGNPADTLATTKSKPSKKLRNHRRAASTTASSDNSSSKTSTSVKHDKGWSDAAKGTAIGGGSGAIIGAVVGKNVKGAVIGGVVGAGAGYAIGRSKDKKSGRVARKKQSKE